MPRPPDAVRASRRWLRRRAHLHGPWLSVTRECVEHGWTATCVSRREAA